MFSGTESSLQKLVEQWLSEISMPFLAQWETPLKSRSDLVLFNSHSDKRPWCVIEIKRGLSAKHTKVTELADHFEQCLKYHADTGLPVFLGPFFIPTMAVDWCMQGGAEPKCATASFSALAGRANVGMFFVHAAPGCESKPEKWQGFRMTLRNNTVARWNKYEQHCTWPTGSIALASFDGAASSSVRRAA